MKPDLLAKKQNCFIHVTETTREYHVTTTEQSQSELIDEGTYKRSMGKLSANSRQSYTDWVKHEEA